MGRAPGGDSDVIAFARDLEVSYRVWSPKRRLPPQTRTTATSTPCTTTPDSVQHVSRRSIPRPTRKPHDPASVPAVIEQDARDFVDRVVARLAAVEAARGEPGLVVAAFDTRTLRALVA